MRITLKIKKLSNCKSIPAYQTKGAAGMDLSAGIDTPIIIEPFQRILVPTGICIELPEGYEAQIRARSGLSFKKGITLINGIGTIDEDYRGEIGVALINLSNEAYKILPGERIAQMIISKVTKAKIDVVTDLTTTQRSSAGFGSTGV